LIVEFATMAPAPKLSRAAWFLAFALGFSPAGARDGASDAPGTSASALDTTAFPAPAAGAKPKPDAVRARNFRTFLPKPGEAIDEPSSQVVQVLLDRQDKGDQESYMVQVIFRGKPSERSFRAFEDRVEIDFYDTGKPSMRLSRIRGGAVEASSLEELYYKDPAPKARPGGAPRIKRMVRLTLYIHEKVDPKFRDTLDRTLIHFLLAKDGPKEPPQR
jgi:hypothetical protein